MILQNRTSAGPLCSVCQGPRVIEQAASCYRMSDMTHSAVLLRSAARLRPEAVGLSPILRLRRFGSLTRPSVEGFGVDSNLWASIGTLSRPKTRPLLGVEGNRHPSMLFIQEAAIQNGQRTFLITHSWPSHYPPVGASQRKMV